MMTIKIEKMDENNEMIEEEITEEEIIEEQYIEDNNIEDEHIFSFEGVYENCYIRMSTSNIKDLQIALVKIFK